MKLLFYVLALYKGPLMKLLFYVLVTLRCLLGVRSLVTPSLVIMKLFVRRGGLTINATVVINTLTLAKGVKKVQINTCN